MTRDKEIVGCLDERWRTVIQIRSRLGSFGLGGSAHDLTTTLHRLADAGEIERQTLATVAPGRRGNKQMGQRWPSGCKSICLVYRSEPFERRKTASAVTYRIAEAVKILRALGQLGPGPKTSDPGSSITYVNQMAQHPLMCARPRMPGFRW
jgi:hypothetical protein